MGDHSAVVGSELGGKGADGVDTSGGAGLVEQVVVSGLDVET